MCAQVIRVRAGRGPDHVVVDAARDERQMTRGNITTCDDIRGRRLRPQKASFQDQSLQDTVIAVIFFFVSIRMLAWACGY